MEGRHTNNKCMYCELEQEMTTFVEKFFLTIDIKLWQYMVIFFEAGKEERKRRSRKDKIKPNQNCADITCTISSQEQNYIKNNCKKSKKSI